MTTLSFGPLHVKHLAKNRKNLKMKLTIKKALLIAAMSAGFSASTVSAFDYCEHLRISCEQGMNHVVCDDYRRYCS